MGRAKELRRQVSRVAAAWALCWGAIAPAYAQADEPDAETTARGTALFQKHVAEILTKHCLDCHGGKKTESDFNLATREGLLKGGAGGEAIAPGNAKESTLIRLVAHLDEPHMPHETEKLPEESIAHLSAWIDAGAPYHNPLVARAGAPQGKPTVDDTDRQFWSFQPLAKVEPPAVRDAPWCRTPIDRFILAQVEAKGLAPSAPVERRKLIRRAYFDVIGLPPSPGDVEAFVNDTSPDAYEKVVDRLLASPQYGERWARHWLDLARFAESHGYEQDYDRPSAYHYRDFVIQALNEDLPYDVFVRWQIAGDEIAPDNPQALMATGYLAAGTHATQITANQVEKERYDELDDMTGTIGTSMLGLTIGCARCHDHKYDPIPQTDYYRLLSTFTTTVRSEIDLDIHPEKYRAAKADYERAHAPLVEALSAYERDQLPARFKAWRDAQPAPFDAVKYAVATEEALASLAPSEMNLPAAVSRWAAAARLWSLPEPERDAMLASWFAPLDEGWRKLNDAVVAHRSKSPKPELQKVLISSEGLPAIRLHTQGGDFLEKTHFLKRGDLNQKNGEATQSFLQVLMTSSDAEKRWQKAPPKDWRTSYRRTALADWITDTDQGAGNLLARVIVNRLWQHHFGRGIVATPSDFGRQGERPTHPELLDWLAGRLVQDEWRLKPLHKLMLTSATYLQGDGSGDPSIAAARLKADVDNTLWSRMPRRRLEGESIRDAMLAVSGELDSTMFGPGSLDESMRRRSIYFTVKRSKLIPLMMLFDWPDSLQGLGARATTTVAPQALALMNNPHVRGWAKTMADRLSANQDKSTASVAGSAYLQTLGRAATDAEIADAVAFLESQTASYRAAGRNDADKLALADFCQTLFSLNEFVFVE